MFWYQTMHLGVDIQGILWLKDSEQDIRLGPVESSREEVPPDFLHEYDEILDEWEASDSREDVHAEWKAHYYQNLG